MTKIEFLLSLHDRLSGLPQDEVEERLNFYIEMIEDRMEEGLSEEEAVSAVGSVDEIAAQIADDVSHGKVTNENIKSKRRPKTWEIVLLALGSPIWLSLLIVAVAVVISLYVSLWSVIISLWAVFGSFIACAFYGVVSGVGLALSGNDIGGIAMIGAVLFCAGLSIALFFGCEAATKGTLMLTKKIAQWIKNRFTRKDEVK